MSTTQMWGVCWGGGGVWRDKEGGVRRERVQHTHVAQH